MSFWGELSFQDACNSIMECLIYFHDYMMMLLSVIFVFVIYMFFSLINTNLLDKETLESHSLETVWTVLPMFFLFLMAYPSLMMLYYMESVENSSCWINIKVIAHQWYWEYQVADHSGTNVSFDSRMVVDSPSFYSLSVDNSLMIPSGSMIHMFITSVDVLHSWTVPSLGVKVDAIPGRINVINFYSNLLGSFYGQCSEICGANHSFMPINVVVFPSGNLI